MNEKEGTYTIVVKANDRKKFETIGLRLEWVLEGFKVQFYRYEPGNKIKENIKQISCLKAENERLATKNDSLLERYNLLHEAFMELKKEVKK